MIGGNLEKRSTKEVEEIIDQLPLNRGVEVLPVVEAVGRFLATPCYAGISVPTYPASAMDGIAVDWRVTWAATKAQPVVLYLGLTCWLVDTGDPLPDGTDAVIRLEDIHWLSAEAIAIYAGVRAGNYVRQIGEEIAAGELILPAGHRLKPVDLAGLLAGGVTHVEVWRQPLIRILPTGSELIEPGEEQVRGSVIEYISPTLSALISEWGGEVIREKRVADKPELIKAAIRRALDGDLLIVLAGTSKGREDYTAAVVAELGQIHMHGIALKPGKPLLIGTIAGTPVIGLPGYPVAALLNAQLFVQRWLANYYGRLPVCVSQMQASLRRPYFSPLGTTEFMRVKLGQVNGRTVAIPLSRKAGIITSLLRADGLVRIPENQSTLRVGEEVTVDLLREGVDPAKHILLAGPSDPALDRLANFIHANYLEYELFSEMTETLENFTNGEFLVQGVRILEVERSVAANQNAAMDKTLSDTLEYSFFAVQGGSVRESLQRIFHGSCGGEDVVMVNFCTRSLGLILSKDFFGKAQGRVYLPPTSFSYKDVLMVLERTEGLTIVTEINSVERESLTNILLKKEESRLNMLNANWVEAKNFWRVAATIKAGIADLGIGTEMVAKEADLYFVPLGVERYVLLFLRRDAATPGVEIILRALQDARLQAEIRSLTGYHTDEMGNLFFEGRIVN